MRRPATRIDLASLPHPPVPPLKTHPKWRIPNRALPRAGPGPIRPNRRILKECPLDHDPRPRETLPMRRGRVGPCVAALVAVSGCLVGVGSLPSAASAAEFATYDFTGTVRSYTVPD